MLLNRGSSLNNGVVKVGGKAKEELNDTLLQEEFLWMQKIKS